MKLYFPKISVIITCYNSEQYIEKCLDSVIAQTLKGIEIIIVDDGSIDSTPTIIKNYASNYKNIKLIFSKVNCGAGYSKNIGVSASNGRYIGFVDSDDHIEPNYFKKLYHAARLFNAEIAYADIALEYPDKIVKSNLLNENVYLNVNGIAIKKRKLPHIIENCVAFAHWSAAAAPNKIFKKSLIVKYPFYEGVCDDLPAVLPALVHANKIVYVPNLYYYYVQRQGSLENSAFSEKRVEIANVINNTIARIKDINSSLYSKLIFVNNVYYVLIQIANVQNSNHRLDYLKRFHSCFKNINLSIIFSFIENPYLNYTVQYDNVGMQLYFKELISFFSKGEIEMANNHIDQWSHKKEYFRPKVSIIIPVYNGSNYIRDAIGSALSQTYPNLEVIVVNDGSCDNGETEKIALSYGDRIRYFSKENGGVASALNLGIEKMSGEYFSWLSHDDMYTFQKLEKQVEILATLENKTTILTGGYSVMDANQKHLYDVDPLKLYPNELLENSVRPLLRGCIHGCAMLIHKSHFERVGLFDTILPTTQDYDLFFRILRGQKLKFHNGLYVLSRCHDQQDSRKLKDSHISECNNLWIGMMKQLSDQEKCELEGSKYFFYRNIYDFLKTTTAYDEAIIYAGNHAFEEARKEILATINKSSSYRKLIIKDIMNHTGMSKLELANPVYKESLEKPKNRPRIAFLVGDINVLGGLNRVVLKISSELCNYYDVYLIFFEKVSGKGYTFDKRLKEIMFPFGRDKKEFQDKLVNRLKLINVDVLVCSHNCANAYLELYPLLQQYGIKTIAWNHEFYFLPYWNDQIRDCLPIKNKALSRADVAIWLNSFSANAYSLLHSNGAIMPNPVTIEVPTYHDILGRPKNIIAVGRFDDPQKGLAELLYVLAKILVKSPTTKLNIVGPFNLKEMVPNKQGITYEQLIKKLGLPDENLNFIGWTKDVERHYKESCVHLMPSCYEGFGLTITEAAAYGIPSVIFEGSGLEDIITSGIDGYIVPQKDTDAMAEKAINLLSDKDLLKSMSDSSRLIIKRYELSKVINRWQELIEAVLHMNKAELEQYLQSEFMFSVKDKNAFCRQIANEYENCVISLSSCADPINNRNEPYVSPELIETANLYIAEVSAMQQSLSWRITKPLRWIKKILVSIKKFGLKITFEKVIRKVKMKIQG